MRTRLAALAVLSLLSLALASGAPPTSAQAAKPDRSNPNVESAWGASFGLGDGDATISAFDTGAGSLVLSLRNLSRSADYSVIITGGTCPARGPMIVSVGTLRSGPSGRLSVTRALDEAQVAAIRDAASGTNRVSILVGTGSKARCATFAKSLDVTPQVWFSPISGWGDLPYVGSTDYTALFDANAAWPQAAGRTHVFEFFAQWVDQHHAGTPTDAELSREIAALKARDIAISVSVGPLAPGPNGCGVGVEGYTGGAQAEALPIIRRIASLGGTVRYISLDEPFHGAVVYEGTNACSSTVEATAQEVARFVREVKAIYPSIVIGDIEPWPAVSTELLGRWLDAYEAAAGSPFPFLHLDVNWAVAPSDWPAQVHGIEADVRSHGSRFGLIYNGYAGACEPCTDADWLDAAQAHVLAYELDGGGPPNDALFYSWTDHPDYVLPEVGPDTFTHLMADYTRQRTRLSIDTPSSVGGGLPAVSGRVTTLGGRPIPGAPVDLVATPRDGPYQILEFRGTVPAGASGAVIGIRVNDEGAGPGSADLTVYEIGYSEGTDPANQVPNATFEEGLHYWGPPGGDGSLTVVPSDRGSGQMLRVVATSSQTLSSNSGGFMVTPGNAYRMWLAVRVPEASIGSTDVAAIFLSDTEVTRDTHHLAPAPIPAGSATTDATGRFSLTSGVLEPGRYHLRAAYGGDAALWPAWADVDVTAP